MTDLERGPEVRKASIEVERKFLVGDLPPNLEDYEHASIRQGYLVIGADGSESRIRDKQGSYSHTVKSKGTLSRGEWEIEIDEDQFEKLWPATNGKRVEKTRYRIPHEDGSIIELDVYKGEHAGLVVAEVEFPSETIAKTFQPPEWFSIEVTEDKNFKNQNLALNGLPA